MAKITNYGKFLFRMCRICLGIREWQRCWKIDLLMSFPHLDFCVYMYRRYFLTDSKCSHLDSHFLYFHICIQISEMCGRPQISTSGFKYLRCVKCDRFPHFSNNNNQQWRCQDKPPPCSAQLTMASGTNTTIKERGFEHLRLALLMHQMVSIYPVTSLWDFCYWVQDVLCVHAQHGSECVCQWTMPPFDSMHGYIFM